MITEQIAWDFDIDPPDLLGPPFHMLTLVTPGSAGRESTADCACGVRTHDPDHNRAQSLLLTHLWKVRVNGFASTPKWPEIAVAADSLRTVGGCMSYVAAALEYDHRGLAPTGKSEIPCRNEPKEVGKNADQR